MNPHVEINYVNKTQVIPPALKDIKKNEELIYNACGIANS